MRLVREALIRERKLLKKLGWLGLRSLWWKSVLNSAKISTNGRPPFNPPKASKNPEVLSSSPVCPSGLFSKPTTIVDPAVFMLAELPEAGASGSKAHEAEGMRETLGVGPSFFPKNGDLSNRVGEEGKTEE